MSNKQSSVEWLITQLQKSKDWHRVLNEISQMSSARVDIIEQAKAMHKEEISQAFDDGEYNYFYSRKTGNDFDDGKEYYEEKFGGNNDQQ